LPLGFFRLALGLLLLALGLLLLALGLLLLPPRLLLLPLSLGVCGLSFTLPRLLGLARCGFLGFLLLPLCRFLLLQEQPASATDSLREP